MVKNAPNADVLRERKGSGRFFGTVDYYAWKQSLHLLERTDCCWDDGRRRVNARDTVFLAC